MAHEIDSDKPPTVQKHIIHYPLNGLGLDFRRYSPPRFGPKSVLASRIFQDYLFPKRLTPETYSKRKWLPKANVKGSLGSFEMLDSGLYREYITLDNLKTRSLLWEARFSRFNNQPCSRDNLATAVRLEDITQDILQRFFLESESETLHEVLSIHAKMNQFDARGNRSLRARRSWAMPDARDFPRLQWLEDDYKLYPGPSTQSHASIYLNSIDSALSIGGDTDLLVRPALCTSKRQFRACPFPPFPR